MTWAQIFGKIAWTEIFGNLMGILSVWLTARNNIWCWPTGIANSAFYIVLFVPAGLYSGTTLQILYIALGFYGWYAWLYGGEKQTRLPISRTGMRIWLLLALLGVVGTVLLGRFMQQKMHASVPYWDAGTTVACLLAQWMLTRKLLENWFVWIGTNLSYIALYIYKGLYITSAVQVIYIALSVLGYFTWKREFYKQKG